MGLRVGSRWLVVLAMCVVGLLGACGDDEDTTSGSKDDGSSVAEGDVAQYCELVATLDEEGSVYFQELEADENATEQDYEEAEAGFIVAYRDELDAMAAAAPSEIKEDVDTIVASLHGRAGLGPEVDQAEASAAEETVQEFEQTNC